MKVIKHELVTTLAGNKVYRKLYGTKEEALSHVKSTGYIKREYRGEAEVLLYCENCDKDLKPGDNYLKVDEDTRYCSDCYEEGSFTYYTVGGEHVGDENDAEVYDQFDKEVEEEAECSKY